MIITTVVHPTRKAFILVYVDMVADDQTVNELRWSREYRIPSDQTRQLHIRHFASIMKQSRTMTCCRSCYVDDEKRYTLILISSYNAFPNRTCFRVPPLLPHNLHHTHTIYHPLNKLP